MRNNTITAEEVARIADLARLELSDEELAAAARDLAGILQHFSQIQHIDTSGVPTADDASGLKNVMREDEAKPQDLASHEQLLNAAPEVKDNHIQVKAVFK